MYFYDPLYGRIDMPRPLEGVANSSHFRRLQHLRQLGLCYLAFPGGNHTRFEHSLGAFHLARLITQSFQRSDISDSSDRLRLQWLVTSAALCHDIGHGPFSHMSENVLNALGINITHEEVGAAIICGPMREILEPLTEFGVEPELIASTITKSLHTDSVVSSAASLVASDLDVDRFDYLYRDAHYAGSLGGGRLPMSEFPDAWQIKMIGSRYAMELTERGVHLAEHILYLRRNNYIRIVFDSAHMAATGMFEKALFESFSSDTDLGVSLRALQGVTLDWRNPNAEILNIVQKIYGLVDFEALGMIERSSRTSQYLIQRIRRGKLYESAGRWSWPLIHYSARSYLVEIINGKAAFDCSRKVEGWLAESARVDAKHISVYIPAFRTPGPLIYGITNGHTLGDVTELANFFHGDYLRQYHAEVFVDPQVASKDRTTIEKAAEDLFVNGKLAQIVIGV